ncbi:MAG: hypothetical protein JO264_02925 [Acidisphaera sp.]|nr:hypothetical protein [Acidisphaera sp.]
MAGEPHEPRWDIIPLLVLAGLILAGLAGWWLFPTFYRYISNQDCIASGRTDCPSLPTYSR